MSDKYTVLDNEPNNFDALLRYVDHLARHKLGYPVSLLTYLGIIDNRVLGIRPGTLANVLLNNVGDPFKDSETSLMEVKKHERRLLNILEHYYGVESGRIRGYVTTGGTEGNFAGLWWSKRYLISFHLNQLIEIDNKIKINLKEEQDLTTELLKIPLSAYDVRIEQLKKIIESKETIDRLKNELQQLLTPTVFFTKGHTHYSIPKISEILKLNIKAILPKKDGQMDLENFKKELLFHIQAHPYSSVIVIANIGTTITGAIDNVPEIRKILKEMCTKMSYTIHMDGALTGFVLPILKPFGDIKNYFDALGVNTLAVSAHKYPGLSQPCGVILANQAFFEKAFEKSERSIDYVGDILDVTITGSRSGLNVLMFFNALHILELHKGTEKLAQMVKKNIEVAEYLYKQLIIIFGPEKVYYPYHFNVVFPRVSAKLAKKYQLMLTGNNSTICVLSNVTEELIDQFIKDLKIDLNREGNVMKTAALETTITTLKNEHAKSAVELFVKSFCNDEPITKHLKISYQDYEPFAMDVIQKSINDGLSLVALSDDKKVIACVIAEDAADLFKPNFSLYPKMKPIFALLEKLSQPFLSGKKFIRGKVAHVWLDMVDKAYRNQKLSTKIDRACFDLCARKGFEFAFAEFTNNISENIIKHYPINEKLNEINYSELSYEGKKPLADLPGKASSYIWAIKPGIEMDALKDCYMLKT